MMKTYYSSAKPSYTSYNTDRETLGNKYNKNAQFDKNLIEQRKNEIMNRMKDLNNKIALDKEKESTMTSNSYKSFNIQPFSHSEQKQGNSSNVESNQEQQQQSQQHKYDINQASKINESNELDKKIAELENQKAQLLQLANNPSDISEAESLKRELENLRKKALVDIDLINNDFLYERSSCEEQIKLGYDLYQSELEKSSKLIELCTEYQDQFQKHNNDLDDFAKTLKQNYESKIQELERMLQENNEKILEMEQLQAEEEQSLSALGSNKMEIMQKILEMKNGVDEQNAEDQNDDDQNQYEQGEEVTENEIAQYKEIEEIIGQSDLAINEIQKENDRKDAEIGKMEELIQTFKEKFYIMKVDKEGLDLENEKLRQELNQVRKLFKENIQLFQNIEGLDLQDENENTEDEERAEQEAENQNDEYNDGEDLENGGDQNEYEDQ